MGLVKTVLTNCGNTAITGLKGEENGVESGFRFSGRTKECDLIGVVNGLMT